MANERSKSFGSPFRNPEVLVLGCTAAGKTLLIKQLKAICTNKGKMEKLQANYEPTVGVEIDHLKYKTTSFTVREVGSQMCLTWPSYYERCAMVLYVVDKANRAQASQSFVELLNLVKAEKLAHTPICILFNKCDAPFAIPSHELSLLFRLDDLCKCASQQLTVMHSSAHEASTMNAILEHIHKVFSTNPNNLHRN